MNDMVKKDTTEVPEISYNKEQMDMIKNMYAKNATDDELKLLMYMSRKYSLDILTREIWCVKFAGQPAQIYAGRDGFLEVAHRSGKLDGMESGTKNVGGELVGWCNVYRKDMSHPIAIEVPFEEYNTGMALWKTKPRTMIQKVAESQALRRAFRISGIYSPEEMGQWEEENKNPDYEPPKTSIAANNAPKAKSKAKPKAKVKAKVKEEVQELDVDTYIVDFGKHKGKKMVDVPSSYLEWLIEESKKTTYKTTKQGYPMQNWISFLETCLAVHNAQKEEPADAEDVQYDTISEQEQEDIERNVQ